MISSSFLQWFVFLSILFLSFFIICSTSFLNSRSGRLVRSVLLFVCSKALSCCFNWEYFLCFCIILIFLYEFRRHIHLLRSCRTDFMLKFLCVEHLSWILLVWGVDLVWVPATSPRRVCWPLSPIKQCVFGTVLSRTCTKLRHVLLFDLWLSYLFQGQAAPQFLE